MKMATVLKVEPEQETCFVCGVGNEELLYPEEHDASMPTAQVTLRAMLLHLNNNKVVPNGKLCMQCIRRTLDAYNFSTALSSSGPPPLSEKIQTLRKRLHELTQKIDVYIVVGGGTDGNYSEEDIIMVERDALQAASENGQPPRTALVRPELGYQCTVCPETFQRVSLLREHLVSHGSVSVHNCWTCGAQFETSTAALEHAATHSLPDRTCHVCDTTFQTTINLREHESTCTTCSECGEQFGSRPELVSHMGAHPNRCDKCLASVPAGERAAHRLAHARAQRFVCGYDACILRFATSDICGYKRDYSNRVLPVTSSKCLSEYWARNDLLAHIRKCHNDDPEPATETVPASPQCSVCDRVFGSVAALKRHSKVHRYEKAVPVSAMDSTEYVEEDDGRIEYLEVETLEEMENDE